MVVTSAIVVFSVLWWLVFFIALPIGVHIPKEQEAGHAASAPTAPRLAVKALWTTAISALLTAIIVWLFASGTLNWQHLLGVENFRWEELR